MVPIAVSVSVTATVPVPFAANPNCIAAWNLAGTIALQQFNFDGCDNAVMAIRRTDADSIDANLLEARNYLLQRVPKEAMPQARKASPPLRHNRLRGETLG